jgi:hypothetical protein
LEQGADLTVAPIGKPHIEVLFDPEDEGDVMFGEIGHPGCAEEFPTGDQAGDQAGDRGGAEEGTRSATAKRCAGRLSNCRRGPSPSTGGQRRCRRKARQHENIDVAPAELPVRAIQCEQPGPLA